MITKSYNNLSKEEFLKIYLELFNVLQQEENKLTNKQMLVLIEFILLDLEVHRFSTFTAIGKKTVVRRLAEKFGYKITPRRLDSFIYLMTKKGYITRDADRVKYLNKNLKKYIDIALETKGPVTFTFKMDIKNEHSS